MAPKPLGSTRFGVSAGFGRSFDLAVQFFESPGRRIEATELRPPYGAASELRGSPVSSDRPMKANAIKKRCRAVPPPRLLICTRSTARNHFVDQTCMRPKMKAVPATLGCFSCPREPPNEPARHQERFGGAGLKGGRPPQRAQDPQRIAGRKMITRLG